MSKSTAEIRQMFLDFFHNKGHQIVASSSLIPDNDATLLFTNAGMNQFKNIFLGLEKCNYSCVTTAQRCVRAGGKHNDLENVGYTSRHHTFFEMLGNFSFGEYFKHEAIQYAWELLTEKNWFNLSKERLLVTVHENDNETYKIWEKEVGISRERIIRVGGNSKNASYTSDNFWQMGDTGPCGPCTEIFYDRGDLILGELSENSNKVGDRYIEIWNIVFIQFIRQADGTIESLTKPSVDTGMGLERIASVLQYVRSNYDIDLFRALIKSVAKVTGTSDLSHRSLRVIADHIRSCAFLISDGVIPSNENRGYVLRRIIRRAIRHGNMLGVKEVFFYKLVGPLIEVMEEVSENLKRQQAQIELILKKEEEQFSRTLERGLVLLEEKLSKLEGDTLNGEIVFRLYDTYGFPIDLTEDVCRERNIKVDKTGFKAAMTRQCYHARKSSDFIATNSISIDSISEFQGYNHLELDSNVIALFVDGKMANNVNTEQEVIVFLDKTSFYAESGGQVGDQGELRGHNFNFKVNDTRKYGQAIGHHGRLLSGSIEVGDSVQTLIDKARRERISLNHSATHLMHAALNKVIGTSVVQKGSLINDRMLRFDFSCFRAIKLEEIRLIENLVNMQVRRNLLVETNIMNLEVAKAKGAIALSGKKYNEYVRVLSIGDFSVEICGGTHASRTGDIGLFCIVSEYSIAANIRRIEAVTGENAIANMHMKSDQLCIISQLLKSNNHDLSDKVCQLIRRNNQLEKELQCCKKKIAIQECINLSKKSFKIKGVSLLIKELKDIDPVMLRIMVDDLKNRLDPVVIVLATVFRGKVFLIAGVSKDVINRIKADKLINIVAEKVGGKGGGRPDIAQGGGTDVSAISVALASIESWVKEKL